MSEMVGVRLRAQRGRLQDKSVVGSGNRLAVRLVLLAGVAALSGCAMNVRTQKMAVDEDPVVVGAAVRRNYTPMEPALACLARTLYEKKQPTLGIAVGDVKDYTGKYSQNEGNTITQGGALMLYSALGKLGGAVQVQERFDTRIAELELAYTDRRQLGDGRNHQLESGKPPVPWMPYFGGSIMRSDYYIVGGITEVNYNISSGGVNASLSNMGVAARTYTMNIGVDLRIVDTRSLVVLKTVSLEKQIIGQEVGANVYRFFGTTLVDVNAGAKRQEPLQLGVRTAIEQGVVELIAAVGGVDPGPCLEISLEKYRGGKSTEKSGANNAAPGTALPAPKIDPDADQGRETLPAGTQSGLQPQNAAGNGSSGGAQQVPFDFGSAAISTQAMSVLDKIAKDVAQGGTANFKLLARDNELWPPLQRRELTGQRIKALTDALVARGVEASRIGVSWVPAPTDQAITREGAGFQLVATMVVGR